MGGREIGRPLNWTTVQLADPIEYDWISANIFSILLCNYKSHQQFVCEQAYYFLFTRIQNKLNDFESRAVSFLDLYGNLIGFFS